MTFGRLLFRNLLFHWRGNLAVFLGVVVGSAVLTGALLVGDSLRGSLRDRTLQQLGWVEHALVAGRFLRAEIASKLGAERASPVLLLRGSARVPGDDKKEGSQAGKVTILGVDRSFWLDEYPTLSPPLPADFFESTKDEVILNAELARKLGVGTGDKVTLNVQKTSAVPRETLLGRRDASEVVEEWKLTVAGVLSAESFGGRFNLAPSPMTPRNVFMPLRALQAKLGLSGKVNALLVAGDGKDLAANLHRQLTLDDWGLVLHTPDSRAQALFTKLDRNKDGTLQRNEWRGRVAESLLEETDANKDGELTLAEVKEFYRRRHPYLNLESRQMLLDPAVAEAAYKAAADSGLRLAPTLVYLANNIADAKQGIPYSIVAALDPALPPPLGPFLPTGVAQLKDDEIVLTDWSESPLKARPGATIQLTYFRPEEQGRLRETTESFTLRGLVPLAGVANDPDLTPEFPGITDKLDIRDWNPPFPFDNKRIKKRDDDYWKKYRTTPKAYVTLATGQRLWGSRFGDLTSIRLASGARQAPGTSPVGAQLAKEFDQRLLAHLPPEKGGLVFEPVCAQGLQASSGGTDFSVLFLSFSFFLIVAALLLVGLLFRLNLDRRASEVGLLLATGFRRTTVRRLLLAEGSMLAAAGAVVGGAGALVYAWLLVEFLCAWWPGGLDRSFLRLHATPLTFIIGFVAALVVSVLTIAWAVRILGQVAPSALLQGECLRSDDQPASVVSRRSRFVLVGSVLAAIGCVVLSSFVHDHELKALAFFGSGASLLVAGLAAVWSWLRSTRHGRVGGHGWPALARLGCRNAARNPVRSLLTAGLLASAAFLIVAVDSFRRQPEHDFLEKTSGSGGFSLLAEADLPIFQDLNTDQGRDELNFSDKVREGLHGVSFYSFRLRQGDDASCLNLYQPRRPRLLGVPQGLIERGGFHFQSTAKPASDGSWEGNPWELLNEALPDDTVPVFGEANTVMWMLKSGLDGVLEVPDERGRIVKLRIVGLLKDSVFQSELLMSEANFLKLYPGHEGYNYFLIDAPPERSRDVERLLAQALAERGFEATATSRRLQEYLAVENTYLSTFQALGGLGLLLGALGLAIVLMRSVWERRGELALLRALGYRQSALGWLILAENSFLLAMGLAIGTAAALVAVAPHLLEQAGGVAVWRLLGFLMVVLLVGLSAGAAAVVSALRTPLLPALRRE